MHTAGTTIAIPVSSTVPVSYDKIIMQLPQNKLRPGKLFLQSLITPIPTELVLPRIYEQRPCD